jgi:endonuclease/exonuclease/phosphatase family metal-dependent hydrolase
VSVDVLRLRVATWNIRNVADRWAERKPLLAAAFRELAPDLCGLQELSLAGERQDDLLAGALGGHPRTLAAESPRFPGFGTAIIVARGEVLTHEVLDLGHGRTVQRALIALPGGLTLWFATTHLHHRPGEDGVRRAQAELLAAWMDAAPRADAEAVAGDFNARPGEPAYAVMEGAGYRSAYREANGSEPAATWPTGIIAPGMDTEGEPGCLDYVWVRGSLAVERAWLAGTAAAAHDPGLYPSDHVAVAADVRVG